MSTKLTRKAHHSKPEGAIIVSVLDNSFLFFTMPKAKVERKQRHDPLHVSIEENSGHLRKTNASRPSKKKSVSRNSSDEETFIDSSTTKRILDLAKEQQLESESESESPGVPFAHRETNEELSDNQEEWFDEQDEPSDLEAYGEIEDLEVDPEEDALFSKYTEPSRQDTLSAAQRILDKFNQQQKELQILVHGNGAEDPEAKGVMLPPKVIQVYTTIGELLSRYRSGKLPRAFKIVPSLRNWMDVLFVTNPLAWSNQAVYEGTKLFVSNLPSKQARKFVLEVLYERFRNQVNETKNVNYHVYRALKKSLYKPAAFFKGFLFPLVGSGDCTLREACIASSILARVSVPVLHSAAALLHLAEMEYSAPKSLFIKVLLDKKYALPYKVVDAMVFHFVQFRATTNITLPVVWHQSLLVFAQRYKNDLTEDQRDSLLAVIRAQEHHSITPEIRRELMAGQPRQDPEPQSAPMIV